jgi:hypothetical protein
MKHIIGIFVFYGLLPLTCAAQFVVSGNVQFGAIPGSRVTISTAGDVINESDFTFEVANLKLSLIGSTQTVEGNFVLDHLVVNGQAISLFGNVGVTSALDFISGKITVPATSNFSYRGPSATLIVDQTVPNDDAYVSGAFYQQGGGERLYPVGTESNYAPLQFTDLQETAEPVGVEAIPGAPNLHIDNPTITKILSTFHWQILISNPANINSPVRLPLPLEGEIDVDNETAIVVQDVNGSVQSLGSHASDLNLISERNVTSTIVAMAATTEIDITIHELITPHGSFDKNDELEISNLQAFTYNKVMFLDRYGVLLKEWENYAKGREKDFFKKLSPGNFIVIVEYGDSKAGTRRKSQMITVLRTK